MAAVEIVGVELFRSPDNFSREYWSSFEYQDVQFGVRLEITADFVGRNAWLPVTLMCLIVATLPSAMTIDSSTRLRSSGMTFGLIETLYLPRL